MKVSVVLEQRFDCTPDGRVWDQTTYPYQFWRRYLEVFDSVQIAARIRHVESVPNDYKQVDGLNVSIAPIPFYIGPLKYLLRARKISQSSVRAINNQDALILRVPSQLGNIISARFNKQKRPYALEVVGDPFDVFAPSVVNHPLRWFFRWWFTCNLRQQCLKAVAVAYVTEKTLQKRYPVGLNTFSTSYSSVQLPESAFSTGQKRIPSKNSLKTIVFVGSLSQPYKGLNILLEAIEKCIKEDLNIKLIVIGDGKYRANSEKKAYLLKINNAVHFFGQLPAGRAIRQNLDKADIFVLPAKTEGLPRAMIEAMARGLPCIGTSVGGIPELLAPEDMVPPGEATALADKIKKVLSDKDRMMRMSAHNLEKAQNYRSDVLQLKRRKFYQEVRDRTESWLRLRA